MLYTFNELYNYVKTEFGINPDSATSIFKPITQTFKRGELDTNVEIDDSNIYFVDNSGKKHKGYLYIESGYSRETARRKGYTTIVPKFHIANCQTIVQKRMERDFDGKYVFSNEVTTMIDLDGIEKELTICLNCIRMRLPNVYKNMTTSEYRKEVILNNHASSNFNDNDLPKQITTDFWGYTHDWDEQSKNYRMSKKFTCENCGLNLGTNLSDGFYLETHHIDGNKRNNIDSNLTCLCVLCHANIDKIHQENYSRGPSKLKLREFIQIFYERLQSVGNPYISNY